jgi:DNA-directed RNA polymerase specialized sigma24 family protein
MTSESHRVEPLQRLLEQLGPSPEAAGEAYESLRRLLRRFFEVRDCPDAATLCDEVIDRVARRLADGIAIVNLPAYAHGVARLVFLEARRRPDALPLDALPADPAAPAPADDDLAARCLDGCLGLLDEPTRSLVIAYYTSDGRQRIESRRRLAVDLGVSATALRLRMLRARLGLERCVEACLARAASRNTHARGNTHQ